MARAGGLRFDELFIDYTGIPDLADYPTRDGSRLPLRHYPADSQLHLVLLHGSGYHSRYLFPLARAISAQQVAQVYTPDLRGHGLAPVRRGDIDFVGQLEEDVADLVAHIRTLDPAARIAIGGHSSGGGLALRFAGGVHGEESAGYLLLAPFLRHGASTTRPDAGGWAHAKVGRIVALGLLNALRIGAFDDRIVISFDMPDEVCDGSETLAYSHRLNAGFAPRNYETDLAAIDAPLLVLVGSDDEAFVADAYPTTIAKSAPHAEVRILPGASHMGSAVGAPAISQVVEWLARL